jgi:predicted adenine nucleotide alpha hydrolase (AANH) superfamily ATPase
VSPAPKPGLLLHCCCAPCGTHPIRLLSDDFSVTAFFYNPNLHPEMEYSIRRTEMESLCRRWNIPFETGERDAPAWGEAVRGLETEPEGGLRCDRCIRFRLEATARRAAALGFAAFTTTLSISPHKRADRINRIGLEIAGLSGLEFVEADFKKKDGFKSSCDLSRAEGLYRQDYCGCEFSLLEARARRKPA